MKVNKTPEIKEIVDATFPDYKGCKFRIVAYDPDKPFVCDGNYWDGGTRNYWAAINLKTLKCLSLPGQNPMIDHDMQGRLWADIAMVEHSIFCGQDIGITIHVHPDNLRKLLPLQQVTLTPLQSAQQDLNHAHGLLKRWLEKEKVTQTKVQKYKDSVKYYEKKVAALAYPEQNNTSVTFVIH